MFLVFLFKINLDLNLCNFWFSSQMGTIFGHSGVIEYIMWCKEKGFPLFLLWVCVLRSEFVFLLFLFKTHLDLNSSHFWFLIFFI